MADNEDFDDLKAKKISYHCVGESFLSAEIKRDGTLELRASQAGQI